VKRLNAMVTTVKANYRLAWNGLNTYCITYKAPMVWSFDTPRHLTVMCILETKRYGSCVVQYYQQGITLWTACTRVCFHSVYKTIACYSVVMQISGRQSW
jgi:hypothetical protein